MIDLTKLKGMPVPLGWRTKTIYGGPYRQIPEGMWGVKMAVEIDAKCVIDVPTKDFSVPQESVLLYGVDQALWALARGKPVYVGCMGGVGRTGLFMAALAKAVGVHDPVGYVRAHYKEHAVETKEQMLYIKNLDTRVLLETVRRAGREATLRFWQK